MSHAARGESGDIRFFAGVGGGDTGNWLPVAEGQEVFHKSGVHRMICVCVVNAIRLAGGGSNAHDLLLLRNTGNQLPVPPARALEWNIKGLDFADALHLAKSPDAQAFVTFDKGLMKNGTVLSPIPLREP